MKMKTLNRRSNRLLTAGNTTPSGMLFVQLILETDKQADRRTGLSSHVQLKLQWLTDIFVERDPTRLRQQRQTEPTLAKIRLT
jgi:hypothetical protein